MLDSTRPFPDINSAIPWRETRMPVGGPVGNSACSQGRL